MVGLPNVGKSTLFNALTATASAQAANYPFCTIEPNIGTVCVPDERLDHLAHIVGSKNIIPTPLQFVDIAGIVKGASTGAGLGNKFLNDIRNVDAIIQVVRCFQDKDIVHVSGEPNPLDDISTIETELLLADMQSLEQRLNKKKTEEDVALLKEIYNAVCAGAMASTVLSSFDPRAKGLNLLTLKPIIYVANVSENFLQNAQGKPNGNPQEATWVQAVKDYGHSKGRPVITVCAQLESELAGVSPEERQELAATFGLTETGLSKIIAKAYELLNCITFFTAGPKEVRAWTVKKNALAPEAASVIHTDFQKGFIRAEVASYADYALCGNVTKLREMGKIRSEGKEYKVQDGDVILFRFNV